MLLWHTAQWTWLAVSNLAVVLPCLVSSQGLTVSTGEGHNEHYTVAVVAEIHNTATSLCPVYEYTITKVNNCLYKSCFNGHVAAAVTTRLWNEFLNQASIEVNNSKWAQSCPSGFNDLYLIKDASEMFSLVANNFATPISYNIQPAVIYNRWNGVHWIWTCVLIKC